MKKEDKKKMVEKNEQKNVVVKLFLSHFLVNTDTYTDTQLFK